MDTNSWTPPMYQHLALLVLREVEMQVIAERSEHERIKSLIQTSQDQLTNAELKLVTHRSLDLAEEHEETIREEVEADYDDEHDDRIKYEVEYNREFYELWKQAVRNRQTVKIKYDSTTSGISERLVDPYKSQAPYGEGYCHLRQEVRRFRFDRVIDIALTDQKFEKKTAKKVD